MADDEILKANNLTVPGQPGATYREGGVIFKIASKLEPEVNSFPFHCTLPHAIQVQSISLANNKIKYLTHFSTINMYLPKLANLSLQNNSIDEFSELDKIAGRGTKVSLLREVILIGNPLREKEVQKGNMQHYSSLVIITQI
jgi:nuclear RNA export factor